MEIIGWIAILILIFIMLIFAIAQYTKESKLQKICEEIAKTLLLGIITLEDKDRESFFEKN